MNYIIGFLIIFVVYFLVDYLLLKRSKKLSLGEFKYMQKRFNISTKVKETNEVKLICSLINSTIVSLVSIIFIYCHYNVFITLFVAFILLFLLIYSIYGIYGSLLKKKDIKK